MPDRDVGRILDVTQAEDWDRVVGSVAAQLGGVDILFNNAGVTLRGDIAADRPGALGSGDADQSHQCLSRLQRRRPGDG